MNTAPTRSLKRLLTETGRISPAYLLTVAACFTLLAGGCSQPLGLGSGTGQFPEGGAGGGFNSNPNSTGPTLAGLRARSGNPGVESGLRVSPSAKWTLKVDPGAAMIAGKQIPITQPGVLNETPAPETTVTGESIVLPDASTSSADHGVPLKALISGGATLPNALDPISVAVWSAAAPPRHLYKKDVDYLLDPVWGELSRKPGGAIPVGQPVFVDYKVRQMRLDTIELRTDGTLQLKKGVPARTAPEAPEADKDTLALATVYLSYNTDRLTADSIFPVGSPLPAPTEEERKAMVAEVSHTRAKLQANSKVTIVFWGDSVTEGQALSDPSQRFPDLVAKALEGEFKGANLNVVNAGAAGANIQQRLPSLDKDVLSHHPDLVVVEFVNDSGLTAQELKKDYTAAVDQMKKAGSEVILTTPNFVMPKMMGIKSLRGKDNRPDVKVIREVARAENVGLADVSRQWEHLADEGIPYTALLANGVNQPDSRGQAIYAQTIEKFF